MEAKGEGLPREGFVERVMWWTNKGPRVARRRPDFPFDLQGPGATGNHLGALELCLLVTTWAGEGQEGLVSDPGPGNKQEQSMMPADALSPWRSPLGSRNVTCLDKSTTGPRDSGTGFVRWTRNAESRELL